jgi:phosphomevalonate kinase
VKEKQKPAGKNDFILPRFDKNKLHKTGLGSSACVLVVTLGALLDKCGEIKLKDLHFLAQKANYLA